MPRSDVDALGIRFVEVRAEAELDRRMDVHPEDASQVPAFESDERATQPEQSVEVQHFTLACDPMAPMRRPRVFSRRR